jgi:SagB-type dehydrogenase family enzyme
MNRAESRIQLPPPRLDGPVSLEAAIARRRSVRRFQPGRLTMEQIGQLLWSAQGVTGDRDVLRAAPSAGACHPLVFYACHRDGVWRYDPAQHSLARHLAIDAREGLMLASYRQRFIAEAACVFAISAIVERTTGRYGERGERRYVPMDIGHAAENLLLQAVALGLAGVPVGAFDDAGVGEALALPKQEVPMYLLPIGHPG